MLLVRMYSYFLTLLMISKTFFMVRTVRCTSSLTMISLPKMYISVHMSL